MSTLAERFHALTSAQKRSVQFTLCEHALETWKRYARWWRRLHYSEGVCGTAHWVDKKLPFDAFESARQGRDVARVEERYGEPITAMQDFDLEFPEPVQFAYYAVYNFFCKYACLEEVPDWVIVNQALSSRQDAKEWVKLLEEAIGSARPPSVAPR